MKDDIDKNYIRMQLVNKLGLNANQTSKLEGLLQANKYIGIGPADNMHSRTIEKKLNFFFSKEKLT